MKTVLVIILFLIFGIVYSQNLSLDYKTVGNVESRNSITLGHKFDGVNGPPMVSIYLWDLKSIEIKLLLTEKRESDNWHYHSFDVSGWKTGSYRFIVGFGKDTFEEIEFFVWNRK